MDAPLVPIITDSTDSTDSTAPRDPTAEDDIGGLRRDIAALRDQLERLETRMSEETRMEESR